MNYYSLIPAVIAAAIALAMFFKPELYSNPGSYKNQALKSLLGDKGYLIFLRFVLAPMIGAGSIYLFIQFLKS